MDFFDTGLILSLLICCTGAAWRGTARFRRRTLKPFSPVHLDPPSRFARLRSCVSSLGALFLDVLLLARTGRKSPYRWAMHTLILVGFMGLTLFHAMDTTITVRLFPGYESTLDPWQFLRNLFGAMALIGTGMAVARRLRNKRLRALSRFQDWALLYLVGAIVLSGFVLEAAKIMSEPVFDDMADEYFIAENPGDLAALRSYWAEEYGVVFRQPVTMNPDVLARGAELDVESCTDCHSNTASAFVSRPLAGVLSPAGNVLNLGRADRFFWYLHVVLCFAGIALLPWAKFIHPLTTPINLVRRTHRFDSDAGRSGMKNIYTGPGFDACTRCGECSLHCSVRPVFDVLGNPDILPSEKLMDLKDHVSRKPLSGPALAALNEGSRLCTECMRCTDICPSGIDLQALWAASKAEMETPDDIMRRLSPERLNRIFEDTSSPRLLEHLGLREGEGAADRSDSFLGCVQCTTCTNVCPVVAVSDNPTRDLDLTPQQIMNMLRMGLKDRTLGARMIRSCTTCYKCQEHCPQGVPVADILYELRNTATARVRACGLSSSDQKGQNR